MRRVYTPNSKTSTPIRQPEPVKRLLREHGIRPKANVSSGHHGLPTQAAGAPNRLAQDFSVTVPNRTWLADITYVRTREGWLYLACVLDLFNREIVAGNAERMTRDLVMDALTMAWFRKRPAPGSSITQIGQSVLQPRFPGLLSEYGCWPRSAAGQLL